eukprot:gene10067-1817_t
MEDTNGGTYQCPGMSQPEGPAWAANSRFRVLRDVAEAFLWVMDAAEVVVQPTEAQVVDMFATSASPLLVTGSSDTTSKVNSVLEPSIPARYTPQRPATFSVSVPSHSFVSGSGAEWKHRHPALEPPR